MAAVRPGRHRPQHLLTPLVDIRIEGAEQFKELSRRLKDAGRGDLLKELSKALNRAVKRDLPSYLPDTYAHELRRDLSITTKKRASRDPGISLVAKARSKDRKLGDLDRDGRLKHMLFGNRTRWFSQQVKPEFFTAPIRQEADGIASELVTAMNNIADKIAD